MITCPACATDNEDFFMFCLECGAELAADAAAGGEGLETTEYKASDLALPPETDGDTTAPPEQVPPPPVVPAPPATPPPVKPKEPSAPDLEAPTPIATAAQTAPPPAPPTPPAPPVAPPAAEAAATSQVPAAPKPVKAKPDASSRTTRGRLVLIREDGTDGPTYDLFSDRTVVGRDGGDLHFPQDEFLGTEHAVFEYNGDLLTLTPLDTTNGVFKRIVDQAELATGDSFRIGQELLKFELVQDIDGEPIRDEEGTLALGSPLPPEAWGRLSQMVGTDDAGNVYLLSGQETFMGRERGDIVFPDDGYVSGSHAVIARANNRYFLRDLGSSNGTYVRLKTSEDLYQNDLILAGQQLFRVEP